MTDKQLTQYAPWPDALEALVGRLHYRPGWTFTLKDIERDPVSSHGSAAGGLTFIVTTKGFDSYHPERGETYRVNHYFPVPAATFNAASWMRWLLECLFRVEQHETCEFFTLSQPCCLPYSHGGLSHEAGCTGPHRPLRPFAPLHGPGDDPYVVHEYASDEQRRTKFTGEVL